MKGSRFEVGVQEVRKSRCVCVRKRSQSVAIVRECRARLGVEMVANRRTRSWFSRYKSVNSHRFGGVLAANRRAVVSLGFAPGEERREEIG